MKNELFELVSKNIRYGLDPGLDIEINDFLADLDQVENFFVSAHDSMYVIHINVRKYSIMDVNVVFHRLLTYLEYQGMTFYTQHVFKNSIEYKVVSAANFEVGFCCKIRFAQS